MPTSGQADEALSCLAEAARMIEVANERYHEAELKALPGSRGDPLLLDEKIATSIPSNSLAASSELLSASQSATADANR